MPQKTNRLPDQRRSQGSLPGPSLVLLHALLESVPALLWETGPDLRFTCLTGAALQAVGIAPQLYAGRPVSDLFSKSAGGGGAQRAHEAALRGTQASFSVEVNGREMDATIKPLRSNHGAIVGVAGIALDMTERMVAERALRLSEQSYRSLVEDAPYAICRCTVAGELLQVNRAMAEMLGYGGPADSELLLRDLPLIFTPADSFDAFKKVLMAGGSHPVADGVWLRRDGHSIQVRVGGRMVRDPGGEISHFDIFAENITEKKQLEVELGQAQKMQAVGQLAGGVAHDFNNLLTVISGHVELLLAAGPDETSRERLVQVKEASAKASELTRQLLAFSRRQVLQSRVLNLNEVIGGLMGMLTRVIKENVELIFVPGDALGSVKADPNEVERVLLNLAFNAQDAMAGGGRLTIETANVRVDVQPGHSGMKPGSYVQILVRDTGIGMDAETQARAFEPFFTTKSPDKGTGLGLSVVYGVVKQSGGHVRLQSAPGVGTTVRIYLPRVAAAPTPKRRASGMGPMPRGTETILFAEDDNAIRLLVSRTLEHLGYRVLAAPDGVAAVSLAQSHDGAIDLLLTDMVMPTLGGRELAAVLKNTDPALKVVFISGYAGAAIAEHGLDLPGVCFLQKPFTMDALAVMLRSVLDGVLP